MVADRDEITRLWETVEHLRGRLHDLSGRITALEWQVRQFKRERRFVLSLPARIAAVIITTAAVYAAISVLIQHVR